MWALLVWATIASATLTTEADDKHDKESAGIRGISVAVKIVLPFSDPDRIEGEMCGFPELPFSLYLRTAPLEFEEIAIALSDENGVVQFKDVEVPVGYDRVVFGSHRLRGSTQYDSEELARYQERVDKIRKKFYWPQLCVGCVPLVFKLEDGTTSYGLELELHHGVTLGGVAEHEGGGPVRWGMTWARYANSYGGTGTDGRLSPLIAPKGRANEVFLLGESPVVAFRRVNEREVMTDVDLGRISIPSLERTVAFDGVVTEMRQFNEKRSMAVAGNWLTSGATLISDDGGTILTWLQREEKLVEGGKGSIHAPPGTFYVVPGTFAADEIQLGLLDLIRAGVNLADSGIPSIVLNEGEYGGMHEFNAFEMESAIREAIERHSNTEHDAIEQPPGR